MRRRRGERDMKADRFGKCGVRSAECGIKAEVLSTKYLVLCITVVMIALHAVVDSAALAQQAGEVVVAGKAVRKPMRMVSAQPGRVEAIEQAPIHSKLAAYVGEVLVDYGDRVKKGQAMVKLVAPEVDADLAQKKALVEQAGAELVQAEAGVNAAEAAVKTAAAKVAQFEAGMERAQAELARWRSEYSRIGQLAASGSLNRQIADETQQKLSAAEAAVREAAAAVDAAKAAAAQVQAETAKAAADVTTAKARIRVAEANVAQAEAQHAYLTIKAPLDGVVTQRNVDPGHFVQPGGSASSPVMVVARTDKVRVFVAVPEIEAGLVDVGDKATIEVQSLPGGEIQGTVTRTGFAVDAGNRSLETIIDLDNREARLRPGMFATVKITLAEQANALTLPSAAVKRENGEAFCFRLIAGKAVKTVLKVGMKVGDDFEVISGLSDKDTVILNKAATLKDGQRVEALNTAEKK